MKPHELLKLATGDMASFQPLGENFLPGAGAAFGALAAGVPAAGAGALLAGRGHRRRGALTGGLLGALLGGGAGYLGGEAGRGYALDRIGSPSGYGNVAGSVRQQAAQRFINSLGMGEKAKALWNTKGDLGSAMTGISDQDLAERLGHNARSFAEKVRMPVNPLRYYTPDSFAESMMKLNPEMQHGDPVADETIDYLIQQARQHSGL